MAANAKPPGWPRRASLSWSIAHPDRTHRWRAFSRIEGDTDRADAAQLGRYKLDLEQMHARNAKLPQEGLTLSRIFDELRAFGYQGGYDGKSRTTLLARRCARAQRRFVYEREVGVDVGFGTVGQIRREHLVKGKSIEESPATCSAGEGRRGWAIGARSVISPISTAESLA